MMLIENFADATLDTSKWNFQSNNYGGGDGSYTISNNRIRIANGSGWNNTGLENKNIFRTGGNKLVIEFDYLQISHYGNGGEDQFGFGPAGMSRGGYYMPYTSNWFYVRPLGHMKIIADFIAKTISVYYGSSTTPTSVYPISDTMLTAMNTNGILVDFTTSGYSSACVCEYWDISINDYTSKMLITSDAKNPASNIYSVKSGSMQQIPYSLNELTSAIFDSEGFDDSSLLKQVPFQKYDLLLCGQPGLAPSSRKVGIIDSPKLILSKSDISLVSIQCINQVTVVSNSAGAGSVKFILSKDSGNTWFIFDGVNWVLIDASAPSNVINSGMTLTQINSITKDQWALLNLTSKVRFGYALNIESALDIANTDSIKLNVDMKGKWFEAINGADYRFGYANSSTAYLELCTSGDYKINY